MRIETRVQRASCECALSLAQPATIILLHAQIVHVLKSLLGLPNRLSMLRLLLMLISLQVHGICRRLKFVAMHACCL